MITYCYRCPSCGKVVTTTTLGAAIYCPNAECSTEMNRDYRAEAVGLGRGVRVSSEGFLRKRRRG